MKTGIIVLDTLRDDVFRDQFQWLIEYADHHFTDMYSTSRWTAAAHTSLFTGRYPTEAGTYAGSPDLTADTPTLAEQLSESGFDTVAYSNNVWIDPYYDFDRGFSTFYRGPNNHVLPDDGEPVFDWDAYANADGSRLQNALASLTDAAAADQATTRLLGEAVTRLLNGGLPTYRSGQIDWALDRFPPRGGLAEDSFVYLNLMACHYPYVPPEGFRELTDSVCTDHPMSFVFEHDNEPPEDADRQWRNYVDCARYLSAAIEPIVRSVEWDLLFVVGDHGELFGEHGLREHWYGVYEELTRVPAVALGTAVPSGTTTTPCSLLDVYHTLLAATGHTASRGADLFEELPADRAVYAESVGTDRYSPESDGLEGQVPSSWDEYHFMVRKGDRRLTVDKDGRRVTTPAGIESAPSPSENELVEALQATQTALDASFVPDRAQTDVPEDVQTRLADLGYL